MPSAQFLDAQTQLSDSFLGELRHLPTEPFVNFNNTKQFDTLLRHLEATFQGDIFASVPSKNMLHILFTLAARSPSSNWSHDSFHTFTGAATEYMRMMNKDYDSCLYKATLQHRSATLLTNYVSVLYGQRASDPQAKIALANNVSGVLSTCHKSGTSAFRPRVQKRAQSSIDQYHRQCKKKPRASPSKPRVQGPLDLFLPKAVEVISDSEDELDSMLDPEPLPLIDMEAFPSETPHKAVTSLSDLSTQTSGLGETATLFKQMPHLSHTHTAETEEAPEDVGAKRKKQQLMAPEWQRIKVFDEFLVTKKLSATFSYDIWSLLRWAFWCADTSSQYQNFLFNSSSTHVHEIYLATTDFLRVFFGFCHTELLANISNQQIEKSTIAQLLLEFGPRKEWHDRAVAFTFNGLGRPAFDKPQPLYSREIILSGNDAVAENSRCKTTSDNDDNKDSMKLRLQLLFLFVHYDQVSQDSVFASSSQLMKHVLCKLAPLSLAYIQSFLNTLQLESASHAARALESARPGMLHLLSHEIGFGLLCHMTGTKFGVPSLHAPTFMTQITNILLDERLYRNIVDDLTFMCVEEFVDQWGKLTFLTEWLLSQALEDYMLDKYNGKCISPSDIIKIAKKADMLSARAFEEFLDSRYEDQDLLPETHFTLTRHQINYWMSQQRGANFALIASFKLGCGLVDEGPIIINI